MKRNDMCDSAEKENERIYFSVPVFFVVSIVLFAPFILVLSSLSAFAEPKRDCISHDCTSCHLMSDKEAAVMLKPLELIVKSVKQAPVSGMFEVLVEKTGKEGIVYIDYGKKHLMQGVVVDAKKMEAVSSHSRPLPRGKNLATIEPKSIPEQFSVVLGNPEGAKKLYVFSDPDCPYCRKFHSELIKLEGMVSDVAIHIMLFPLPMHAKAFDKSRVIIAKKNRKLLDDAFEGKELPKPTKDEGKTEIDLIIKFAQEHNIKETPTLVLPDGTVMVGAIDAETLKQMLTGK